MMYHTYALKSYGWGGLCDYRVSSLDLAKSLTIFGIEHFDQNPQLEMISSINYPQNILKIGIVCYIRTHIPQYEIF